MSDQQSSNNSSKNQRTALLLGGGGARAAYQVGVLKAIAELLPPEERNPFPIICGTSAGSINTIALASNAEDYRTGVAKIVQVWSNFELSHVFYADAKNLFKRILNWAWCNLGLGDRTKGPASLLDNSPLRVLLNKHISFEKIDKSIACGDLFAYCLTACSYTSGESTTFYDGDPSIKDWERTHREGRREKMNIDHLMASSAIPVVFPSMKLGDEHFGDGSMRQISPISPAFHLGAEKILIIGLRMEKELTGKRELNPGRPSLGQISGYIMDTLFLNSLYSDLERMERMNRTLNATKKAEQACDEHVNAKSIGLEQVDAGKKEALKIVEHMIVSPTQDIADIAMKHYKDLPKAFRVALKFLGMSKGNSRRFISYLMFTSGFCQELIELGYADAMQNKEALLAFFDS